MCHVENNKYKLFVLGYKYYDHLKNSKKDF